MKKLVLLAITVLSTFGLAGGARGQSETFSDPNVEYTFTVPEPKWKKIATPSATSPNVEFVFGDRTEGRFEVRRLTVQKNAILSEVIRDEEQKLAFLPGYGPGKQENFVGKLRGIVFNFEFVKGGRPMGGRFYFLRAGETTVYVLRFDGREASLKSIQAQTDQIARTFSIVQPK